MDVVRQESSKEEQDVIDALKASLYVDDCVDSLSCADDAKGFRQDSTELLAQAGMDLRKWRSNDHRVASSTASGRVLGHGVVWESGGDTSFAVKDPPSMSGPWTRRQLLQVVASIFDPLGLVAPYAIVGKMCLQQSWKEEGGWDEPLSPALAARVTAWWGETCERRIR